MASSKAGAAGEKVVVGCKLPNGLWLRAFKMVTINEVTLGGTKESKIAEPIGDPFRVHGPAIPFGDIPRFKRVGGYALTEGVPKDLWDAWKEDNKTAPMVLNSLIFAEPDMDRAEARAKEGRKQMSGLEPYMPGGKDPREPRAVPQNLERVKADRPGFEPVVDEEAA